MQIGVASSSQRKRKTSSIGTAKAATGHLMNHWRLAEVAWLFVILAIVPLAFGGRLEFGKSLYVGSVLILALSRCLRQIWQPCDKPKFGLAECLLLAGAGLLVVQLVPWSVDTIHRISPHLAEWLPLRSATSDSAAATEAVRTWFGADWTMITMSPVATRLALIVYTAHALLFWSISTDIRSPDDVIRTTRVIGLACAWMAVLGIAQFFSGTEKYAWLFDHPSRQASVAASGPFANPNHFAHFVALGVGSLMVWLQSMLAHAQLRGYTLERMFARKQRVLCWYIFGIGTLVVTMLLAGAFTRSRGGYLALGSAVTTTVIMMVMRGFANWRSLAAVFAIITILTAGLMIHGWKDAQQELSTLVSGDWDEIDMGGGRRLIWQANVAAIRQFPLFGTGAGSHRHVHPMFLSQKVDCDFTHAESSFLQVLSETGVIGFGLMIIGLVAVFSWWIRSTWRYRDDDARRCWIALGSAMIVSCGHAIIDFPWHLTGCMAISVVVAAAIRGLFAMTPGEGSVRSSSPGTTVPSSGARFYWLAAAGCIVACGVPGLQVMGRWGTASQYWNAYRVLTSDRDRAGFVIGEQAWSAELEQQRRDEAHRSACYELLRQVLRAAPEHPDANQKMASLMLRIAEERQLASANGMGLSSIRDAAYASTFPDLAARDQWLRKVLGAQYDLVRSALICCRRALQSAPLDGQAYANLSSCMFLEHPLPEACQLLVQQAHRLRPHEGSIHFLLGERCLQQGDMEGMLAHWQLAFKYDQELAKTIIRDVAPQMGCQAFVTIFKPSERQLMSLVTLFESLQRRDEVRPVMELLVQTMRERLHADREVSGVDDRLQLIQYLRKLDDSAGALKEARLAVQASPNQFDFHYALARQLIDCNEFAEAVQELAWCSKRRPYHPGIQQLHETLRYRREVASR